MLSAINNSPVQVSRELFDAVQQAMRDRAPAKRKPGRVGSKFLLSGLLRCGVCGRPYTGQGAKSGQFAYYIYGTPYREGAGTCEARYLNAPRVEDFVVEKVLVNQLTRTQVQGTQAQGNRAQENYRRWV